jgi:hypothetical protein
MPYEIGIETAVLLVIVYDILWHRWNAVRELKREEEAEQREIEREKASERRRVQRECKEILRKHWQELQSVLIRLHRIASNVARQKLFIAKHNNTEDVTMKQVLLVMANHMPAALSELNDRWGEAVALLNVFPQPRDVLALEVLTIIQELGKSVGDSSIEVTDETLKALAGLVPKAADRAMLDGGE